MTNPQHEALVEAVARAISNAVDPNTGDPIGNTIHMSDGFAYGEGTVAEQLKKVMAACRSAATAALSATAATPSDEAVRLRAALEEISDYNIRSWQGQHAYRTIYGQEAYERVIWPAVGAPLDPPDTVERLCDALRSIATRAAQLRKGTGDWFELVEFEHIARAALEPQSKDL